jgi:ferredoxin hydrogenase small subunit
VSAKGDFAILWLQAGGCGGCTMAALAADDIGFTRSLDRLGARLLWHPALSAKGGGSVLSLLEDAASGRVPVDALCIEGAVLPGRFHMLAGSSRPMADWIAAIAARARWVVAVGSCAAYGGMSAAEGATTGAGGLQYDDSRPGGLLGEDFRSAAGAPVINVAGCAPHPGWLVETLAALVVDGQAGPLDALGRPRAFADHLAHHGCGRNEFYEFKASATRPSERGCMMENLGCKATQASGDCNLRRWNGFGSCTDGGYACIACTSPGFQDPGAPFQETPKIAGIPVGLPVDMPKAWFVALAALSKSATPARVRRNAHADHVVEPPARHPGRRP